MTVTLRDQIDSTLTTLFKILNGSAYEGRMKAARTVERDLRHLFELARVEEKKKSWFKRLLEWRFIIG